MILWLDNNDNHASVDPKIDGQAGGPTSSVDAAVPSPVHVPDLTQHSEHSQPKHYLTVCSRVPQSDRRAPFLPSLHRLASRFSSLSLTGFGCASPHWAFATTMSSRSSAPAPRLVLL